jgi:hypothetical protein
MESFTSFFFNKGKKKKYGETKNPHHTTDKRIADRGIGFRDGKEQGINFVANKYKEGNHNYDKNKNQHVGPISNEIAFKLCKKHNIDLRHLPKQLGKRPFKLAGSNGNFRIDRIERKGAFDV